jgi:hypothetical protein
MSAEVPTPARDTRRSRPPFFNSNRKQVILFAALTLLLTVATIWGGRVWLRNSDKPGYEFVRDEIGMRRESLKRQGGHDDNVVVVKTAQSP